MRPSESRFTQNSSAVRRLAAGTRARARAGFTSPTVIPHWIGVELLRLFDFKVKFFIHDGFLPWTCSRDVTPSARPNMSISPFADLSGICLSRQSRPPPRRSQPPEPWRPSRNTSHAGMSEVARVRSESRWRRLMRGGGASLSFVKRGVGFWVRRRCRRGAWRTAR